MAPWYDFLYKLKTKEYWWLDLVLYFVLSLLVASVICYFLFGLKISFQKKHLQELDQKIVETGTEQQKDLEQQVFRFQRKLEDFTVIFEDHKISSNLFALIESSTIPNVWFSSFGLSSQGYSVRVRGDTDDFQSLARQIFYFEENKLIKEVNTLSTTLTEDGNINFSLSLLFEPNLLSQFKGTE